MTFAVPGDAYDRFVGRYSRQLSPRFLEFSGVDRGPVLEVGCGPGALTTVLAARFGADAVAAVEPSGPFAAACRARVPGADVRAAGAEALPFADDAFGAVLSQLVLSFVGDAPRAMAEMRRVARPGGTIAACTFADRRLRPGRHLLARRPPARPGRPRRREPPVPHRGVAPRPLPGRGPAGRDAGSDRPRGPLRRLRRLLGSARGRHRPDRRIPAPADGGAAGGAPRGMPRPARTSRAVRSPCRRARSAVPRPRIRLAVTARDAHSLGALPASPSVRAVESRRGRPSQRSLRSGRREEALLGPGVTRRHSLAVRSLREDSGAERDVPAPGGRRPDGTKAPPPVSAIRCARPGSVRKPPGPQEKSAFHARPFTRSTGTGPKTRLSALWSLWSPTRKTVPGGTTVGGTSPHSTPGVQ